MSQSIPISEGSWSFTIKQGIMHDKHFYWMAHSKDFPKMKLHFVSEFFSGGCHSIEAAEADILEFVNLNNIKNFNIYKPNKN